MIFGEILGVFSGQLRGGRNCSITPDNVPARSPDVVSNLRPTGQ